MAEIQLTIDARGISEPEFTILPLPKAFGSPDHHWVSTSTPCTVSLATGVTYAIGVHSCQASGLHFTISPDGKIVFDKNAPLQLQDGHPPVLRVVGLEVTLDATYLAMRGARGVLFGRDRKPAGDTTPGLPGRWIERQALRLIPGQYGIEVGGSTQSAFHFTLLDNGRFDYDPAFDLSAQGFLEGRGTTTIALRGYPVLIDASRLGGEFRIGFLNIQGLPNDNYAMFVNLVPTNVPYRVGVGSTTAGAAETEALSVQIKPMSKGQITTGVGDLYRFDQDTFHGLTRLIVRKKA